jgi:CRP/FNR family transcriptional regulator
MRGLVALVDDLTLKDVKTRLANWLMQRCSHPQSDESCAIELPMTKQVLASELGTCSETLSRNLALFQQQKLLSVDGKKITVLSPVRLARLCGYNPAEHAPARITQLWDHPAATALNGHADARCRLAS